MSTPIVNVLTQVATLLAGLTPPDRTKVTYHHLNAAEPESWTVKDRGFMFGPPARLGPVAETGDRAAALVEWAIEVRYFIAHNGRGYFDLASAVANETSQIARAIEGVTSWPSGVSEVFVEAFAPDDTDPDGIAAAFTLTVLTEDT